MNFKAIKPYRFLFLFLLQILVVNVVSAQCKVFKLMDEGDTLNCIDNKDKKQGKWKIHVDALRGNSGYDEEGIFKDNLKEGVWRKYDDYGLLIALENYRWGNKNGTQKYLENGKLEHEESWKSMDPEKKFDTIDVPDVYDPYKVEQKIFPVKPYAVEHGTWRFYDPETGKLLKKDEYFLGELYVLKPKDDNAVNKTDTLPVKKVVPKEVLDFDKKNKNKKSIKLRDGRTG